MPHEAEHEGAQLDELSDEQLRSLAPELGELGAFTGGGQADEFLGIPPTRTDPETGEEGPFFVRRPRRPVQDPDGSQFGFINVPVTGRVGPDGEPIPDAFRPGDEFKFLDLPLTAQARLLDEMDELGFLDVYGLQRGTPDQRVSAYGQLLAFANQVGATNEEDAIRRFQMMRDRGEIDVSAGTVPQGARPPAPEDMRLAVEGALQNKLGRAPRDTVESMMAAYEARHASDAQGEGPRPPSVEGFVESQVESGELAAEAGAFDFAQRVNDFYGMLGGRVPSPTPQAGSF